MKKLFSPRKTISRYYQSWGRRENQALFNRLVKSPSLKPRLSISMVLGFLFAGLVHMTTLMFIALGPFLLVTYRRSIFAVCAGIFFILFAWVVRPRFGAVPKNCLSRSNHPALFKLVDR